MTDVLLEMTDAEVGRRSPNHLSHFDESLAFDLQ